MIVVAGMALVQLLVVWRVSTRLRLVARVDERLSHFAEALALLTDTTEAGLSNIASEMEQASRRRVSRGGSRIATAKRIVTAVRRGRSLEEIAASEALSESEIRLHLEMSGDDTVIDERSRDASLLV